MTVKPRYQPQSAKPGVVRKPGGRLVLTSGEAELSRIFIMNLVELVNRLDLARRKVYLSDLDVAAVADAIGLAAITSVWASGEFREKFTSYEKPVGVEAQRGINAMSIANATGIPRENVRRKLKKLMEAGYIEEKTPRRYVLKPGYLQKPENLEVFAACIRETMRFMNGCLELGLIKWDPEKKAIEASPTQ